VWVEYGNGADSTGASGSSTIPVPTPSTPCTSADSIPTCRSPRSAASTRSRW
jgi:hypothetical protein